MEVLVKKLAISRVMSRWYNVHGNTLVYFIISFGFMLTKSISGTCLCFSLFYATLEIFSSPLASVLAYLSDHDDRILDSTGF
jgi:hypothetical protein